MSNRRPLGLELLESRLALSFLPGATYEAGEFPVNVVSGDFTSDGHSDLAVLDGVAGNIDVRPGLGDGTFGDVIYSDGTGERGSLLATGDFDGDGLLDLATTSNSPTFWIHQGNGDGTFAAPVGRDLGGPVLQIVVGDFNADGLLDLAGTDWAQRTLRVALNLGDGTFAAYATVIVGTGPQDLAAADFNGDGFLDLTTANSASSSLGIHLGNGDGTFQREITITGFRPVFVNTGDFNLDGLPDVVTSNNLPMATLGVLLGNGDGTFGEPAFYAIREVAFRVQAADFNADGVLDLIALGYNETVSVLLGNSDGPFRDAINLLPQATGGRTDRLAVDDFNADGYADLAYNSVESNVIAVLINDLDWPTGPGPAGDSGWDVIARLLSPGRKRGFASENEPC